MAHTVGRGKWTVRKVGERHALSMRRMEISKDQKPERRRIRELALIREIIAPKILDIESDLINSRWVAHGYLSPLECTELFCREYLRAYLHFYAKYYDSCAVSDLRPVDAKLLQNDRGEVTALWQARQAADSLGIPYGTYINAVMEDAASRAGRKRLPRPNQLYGAKQLDAASKVWASTRSTYRLFDKNWDDRFFHQGLQMNRPRRRALVMGIRWMHERNSDLRVRSLLRSGAITEPMAREIFRKRPQVVDDALRGDTSLTVIRPASDPEKYVPACFGMRIDMTALACIQCPVMLRCRGARQVSDQILLKRTGGTEPLDDRRRKQNRDRKRRERRRKRAQTQSLSCALEAG